MQRQWYLSVLLLAWLSSFAHGADNLQQMNFTIAGVERTALVYIPPTAKTSPTPLVFVFHGHGGSARQADRSFYMER
ncbi:MAG TPA: hypothetical protein VMA13_04740, partial [Candidatus Saccharimonadales bacterium]|nr:hypothetical protein [Candidatus Saccharimonadales bacterium]